MTVTMTEPQQSAKAEIAAFLGQYGLASLGTWAWEAYLNGTSVAQIRLDVRERPEHKARFPGLDELRQKGHDWDETKWIAWEAQAVALFRAHGFPEGFYDQPADFAKYINNEMSIKELDDRLVLAQQDMFDNIPPETRAQYTRLFGLSAGDMTAMWLDPDKALPVLEQRRTMAQIAGEAAISKFGQLTSDQAKQLTQWGVDPAQAGGVFRGLAGMSELTEEFAGETDDISQQTLLNAGFGNDAAASEQIDKRARRRKAEFAGGGSYAAGQTGVTGLGSANR